MHCTLDTPYANFGIVLHILSKAFSNLLQPSKAPYAHMHSQAVHKKHLFHLMEKEVH